ncbi:hypothetical protein A6U98_12800 [Rhizobium sp. WYCCWR10014]|nr:hypothetical protein A6U98_12800 [Rhizobium sp. WYCCWR10014]
MQEPPPQATDHPPSTSKLDPVTNVTLPLKSGVFFCITVPPSMKLIYGTVGARMSDVLRVPRSVPFDA